MTQTSRSNHPKTKLNVGDLSQTGRLVISYDVGRQHGKKYEIECQHCKKVQFGAPEMFDSQCKCRANERAKRRNEKGMAACVGQISLTDREIISYDVNFPHGKKFLIRCNRCSSEIRGSASRFNSPCKKCSYEKKVDLKSPKEFVYEKYSYNAMVRGIPFIIEKQDFFDLISAKCFYCLAEPSNRWKMNRKSGSLFLYNGVDRINSDSGYTKENCVACCGICNRAKGKMTPEEFVGQMRRWAERVENGFQ